MLSWDSGLVLSGHLSGDELSRANALVLDYERGFVGAAPCVEQDHERYVREPGYDVWIGNNRGTYPGTWPASYELYQSGGSLEGP